MDMVVMVKVNSLELFNFQGESFGLIWDKIPTRT